MKQCKRCLYTENHPLNITFDDEGVCSGCRVHEEKFTLDWSEREEKLRAILESYRNADGMNYDCIVPVSGGRDSYYIVHLLKNVYGMNPLLVSYNKHYNTHVGIRNFQYLKTIFDCDTLQMVVQPQKVKKITKSTIKHLGSIYWHVLAGQSVFPVQCAVRFKIPLIVWGVHQGVDQVGMYSHTDEVEMTRRYRKEHDLMGYEAEDLLTLDPDLTQNDLIQYVYPHDKEIEKVGVRGIYLGNYISWDTKKQHEEMIEKYGYETLSQQRTFDSYNDVDCVHYSGLHDFIKYMKFGYAKATDHACREIRWGRLSRDEAFELVNAYEGILPSDTRYLLEWLEMSEEELSTLLAPFQKVVPKVPAAHYSAEPPKECRFTLTLSKSPSVKEEGYTLLEKGYI
ncbi:MAG: N-acetyl sugar amidotransferase [Sulfuricurvum sp.]|uniref:N-acetyl sugar amidotransferase n=1 Tax=Sulfuricurvum sp. TaxID=2025608 RepID=UPI002733C665|nr:N-acetyl sugar amidotransferase [Sulfuricurvum sp.]MDP2849952.1 N-acetyl sugar amidotransferase [Sulfuricurvum sp.]